MFGLKKKKKKKKDYDSDDDVDDGGGDDCKMSSSARGGGGGRGKKGDPVLLDGAGDVKRIKEQSEKVVSDQISLDTIFNELMAKDSEVMLGIQSLHTAGQELRHNNHDIVFMVGATGSGKSTTINFLCDVKLKREFVNKVARVVTATGAKSLCDIGHTNVSKTLVPKFVAVPKHSMTIVDTAGFGENRSLNHALVASFALSASMKACTHVNAVCFVLEFSHFKHARMLILDELYKDIMQMFTEPMEKLDPPLYYLITKVEPGITEQMLRDKLASNIEECKNDRATVKSLLVQRTLVLESLMRNFRFVDPTGDNRALIRTIKDRGDGRRPVSSAKLAQVMTDALLEGAMSMLQQVVEKPAILLDTLEAGVKRVQQLLADVASQKKLVESQKQALVELERTGDVAQAKKRQLAMLESQIVDLETTLEVSSRDLDDRDKRRRELSATVADLSVAREKEVLKVSSTAVYNYMYSEERSFTTPWVRRFDRADPQIENATGVRVVKNEHTATVYYTPTTRKTAVVTLTLYETSANNVTVQSSLKSASSSLEASTKLADDLRRTMTSAEINKQLAQQERQKIEFDMQAEADSLPVAKRELAEKIVAEEKKLADVQRTTAGMKGMCANLCRSFAKHVAPYLVRDRIQLFAYQVSLKRQIDEFVFTVRSFVQTLEDLKSTPHLHQAFEPDPLKLNEFAQLRRQLAECTRIQ